MKTPTSEEKEIIKEIIVDEMGLSIEQILDDSNLQDDLGIDSLTKVHLIMKIESAFNVTIDDDEYSLTDTKKVSDLFALLELSQPNT